MNYPVGTMVVTRVAVEPGDGSRSRPRGACGVVIKQPDQNQTEEAYLVRFPDGGEFWVVASELAVLKHYQSGDLDNSKVNSESNDLYACVEYRCVVGSRAYGLDHADSDTDLRGFYLAPPELLWSLYGVPEQLERADTDECYWELEKFMKLALKANPNVLECLYSPLVRDCSELARELLDMRDLFLSQLIYQTYNRYVMSQFKTMARKREKGLEVKPKHAMHLIRLMLSGITILEEGFVPLDVERYRDKMLAIKRGEVSWPEIESWRLELHEKFDRALESTSLPERPDYTRANDFLVRARAHAARAYIDARG